MGTSSGGGSNGTTKYEWNDDMAPYWRSLIAEANGYADDPYQQYTGQRVAGKDPLTQQSQDLTQHFINDPGQFLYGKGNLATQSTLAGDYLTGPKSDMSANAGNDYGGGVSSPYFQQAMSQGLDQISQHYKDATEPQLRADAVMAGTLGGGDYTRQQGLAQTGLGQTMNQYVTGMQNDQYNRSAGIQAQDLDRGSNAYQQERGRQMGAMGLAQNDQGLTLQRYGALDAMGQYNRGINQQNLDQNYQDWFDQTNHYKNNVSWLTSVLGAAQGGMPATQITSQRSPTSGLANGLGGALAAYGLFKS